MGALKYLLSEVLDRIEHREGPRPAADRALVKEIRAGRVNLLSSTKFGPDGQEVTSLRSIAWDTMNFDREAGLAEVFATFSPVARYPGGRILPRRGLDGRGKVVLPDVTFVAHEIDQIWPDKSGSKSKSASRQPSVATIVDWINSAEPIEKLSSAQHKLRAEQHFGYVLPVINIWRRVMTEIDPRRKFLRGEKVASPNRTTK